MSTHFLLAVRDRQLDGFMRPFTAESVGQAIRSFRDLANEPGSDINKHPEDYELYQIGTFDTQDGSIEQQAKIKLVAIATDLITRSDK